ncbi:MAG: histidine kinase [Isosphaera sp.]|nr:histidine kinase [Isosphaera sp.]
MLGLGLVVGTLGLLVVGVLLGSRAYSATVKTTEQKTKELQLVHQLIERLLGPDEPDLKTDVTDFQASLAAAHQLIDQFKEENQRTVESGFDPDDGRDEAGLVKHLEDDLRKLDDESRRRPVGDDDRSTLVRQWPNVRPVYEDARRCAEHLRLAVIHDIQTGIEQSNRAVHRSKWVIRAATFWAIVLVLALLYYFRVWMFTPIRQLQAGVHRVHTGDFGHPIALTSGDELQELADEFNAMTARLAAIYADLARQVNERSRQLVRSERMVSVGFLAAGVAHEINNPLASILFCSEALERRLAEVLAGGAEPADAEVLTRYLKMVQQEALRCKDITQKLLDFSRTGERKKEPTDLAGLVRGVLEVARHLPNCRGKNISFEPAGYVVAAVNAQDLKSVILNLVVNALDSMDEDGRLAISLSAAGGRAELVFADTGCGMTPDVLQNIFEPFFTKSRTGKGTGLGLFISHQIIDQHGGTIEAASPGPGYGSTFTVRVPLTAAGADAADGADPVTLPFPAGGRVAA